MSKICSQTHDCSHRFREIDIDYCRYSGDGCMHDENIVSIRGGITTYKLTNETIVSLLRRPSGNPLERRAAQRIAALEAENARLRAENSALAAWQCAECGARFPNAVPSH